MYFEHSCDCTCCRIDNVVASQDLTTSGLAMESAMLTANGREPPVTNCTENFRGCLDYVWLSRGSWQVQATLATPYNEGAGPDPKDVDLPPLPNADHPSDHLPVACKVTLL